MLKIYDQQHVLKAQTDKFKDRKIESDVATGDKTLSLTLIGVPEITNEWYIDDGDQEYVVKEAKVSEKNMVAIVAALNLEGLEAKAWKLYSAKNATIVAAADLAVQGTDWTVAPSSITKRRNAGVMKKNALGVIQDLCTAFMCEVVFDTRNKTIYFYDQVGQDRGVYAMRGLNLRSLSRTGNSYDFYTRIIPYGEDDLDIKSVNGGVEYLENFQYSSKIRTFIWEDSNYDDPAALKEDAIAKLDDMSKPKVSYQANIIDLAAMSDKWELLDYSIGDTITLKDSETGICEKQRIVKMTEYPENPEKNTCELSNTTLTWEELQARLKAAAEIVNAVINTDGRYNGKIKVSDILNFEDGVVGEDEQQQEVTLSEALTSIETSANEANQHALEAGRAAVAAQQSADDAQDSADQAQASADQAQASANDATTYANGALSQLGVVEDVIGTLNWISEHGTYALTTDTEVVPGKYYFTRSGNTYTVVINPTGNPSTQGYYELSSVDEAVSNYVASHLSLTNDGLWVTKDNQSYKILLSGTGMRVYDGSGNLVATYGESIRFSSDRPQSIGGEDAYIIFYDSDGDNVPDSINIGGSKVTLGGDKNLADMLDELSNTFVYDNTYELSTVAGRRIATFEAHVYQGGNDVKSRFEPEQFAWYLKTEDGEVPIVNPTTQSNTGYTMAVDISDCGYGAEVVSRFNPDTNDSEALTTDGDTLTTADDDPITVRATGDPIRVRDLTVSTNIYDIDKLMVIGSEDEHLVTMETLADKMWELHGVTIENQPLQKGNNNYEDIGLLSLTNMEIEELLT